MSYMSRYQLLARPIAACAAALLSVSAAATTVVLIPTPLGDIYLDLDENAAPITVENFLTYVRDGDFDNTFIHRVPGAFVIQGGGFGFDSTQGTFMPGSPAVFEVPTDPPIPNEFNQSNLRGTIAMARIGGMPDSATAGWFINVVDNAHLDNVDGGFTVFGKVVQGLDVVDMIDATPIFDLNTNAPMFPGNFDFDEIPLLNGYMTGDPVLDNNLVFTDVISEVFSATPSLVTFTTGVGLSNEMTVTVSNLSGANLTFGTAQTTDPLAAPFSIVTDLCSGMTVADGDSCEITVGFMPTAETASTDSFDLPLAGMNAAFTTISIEGEGVLPGPSIATELNDDTGSFFGRVIGTPVDGSFALLNEGNAPLTISGIQFTSGDVSEFSQTNDCGVVGVSGRCNVSLTFTPELPEGEKLAILTVTSDDPQKPLFDITVKGVAQLDPDFDLDGATDEEEATALNNGDGNVNGTEDRQDRKAASMRNRQGTTITFAAQEDDASEIRNLMLIDNPSPDDAPAGVQFKQGFFSFDIEELTPGAATSVTIVMPDNISVSTYYKYGPTPDNPEPHWYEFSYDGTTGAEIIKGAFFINDFTQLPQFGPVNFVILHFVDGERGDSDLTANGTISDPGGPAAPSSGGGGGGGCSLANTRGNAGAAGHWLLFGILLLWLGLARRRKSDWTFGG